MLEAIVKHNVHIEDQMCMFWSLKTRDVTLSLVSSQKLDRTHTFDTWLYVSLCPYVIEHSFVFRKPKLSRLYSHPILVVHSRFRNLFFYLKTWCNFDSSFFWKTSLYHQGATIWGIDRKSGKRTKAHELESSFLPKRWKKSRKHQSFWPFVQQNTSHYFGIKTIRGRRFKTFRKH